MIRLVQFLRSAGRVSERALDEYRRDELGPLMAGHQVHLGLVRYVQTHRCSASQDLESAFLSLRPGAANGFAGIEEFWWKDEATAVDALTRSDGAFAKILKSRSQWIDSESSTAWFAVDHPQVATSLERVIAAPKSGIIKLTFAISPSVSLSEMRAQRHWLIQHGPLIRTLAPARGVLAYAQVHRQRDDVENALRAAGLLHDGPWMGHAEAWFGEANSPTGDDGRAARLAAVADERDFIDWSRSFVLVGKELVFIDRNWL